MVDAINLKLMLEVHKCLKNENPLFTWNMLHEKSIEYIYNRETCYCCLKLTLLNKGVIVWLFAAVAYGLPSK